MEGTMQNQIATMKSASLGGSGGETEFEQAFSSLAYAYLRDKAPRLLDHMVGFQLVDRNEDNTKAMGIFGFRADNQWLYAPVFFLNGDLKGHELLYMKGNDSFVPMKENWINYIMSRKPHVLGEPSASHIQELGGAMPDIRSLSMHPSSGGSKWAADNDWVQDVLPMLAAFKTKSASSLYPGLGRQAKLDQQQIVGAPFTAALAKTAQNLDFNALMPTSFELLKQAHELSERYPRIKQAMHQFYGPDCFARWGGQLREKLAAEQSNLMPVKQAAERPYMPGSLLLPTERPAAPVDHEKSGKLQMYVYERVIVDQTPELDDEEREKLQKDTVLIKDHRSGEEVSVAYNTQVEAKLTNPSETALYQVLERPGKFTKMLAVVHGHSNRGHEPMTTVVRLGDGDKAWLNSHHTNIFADQISDRQEWDDWFDDLGDFSSLEKGGQYLLVGPDGSATIPFRVLDKRDEQNYTVDFETYYDHREPRPITEPREHNHFGEFGDTEARMPSPYDARLVINAEGRRGTKLRAIAGELRVPDDFKVLRLRKPRHAELEESICCGPMTEPHSKVSPIELGRIEDIHLLFQEKTARMKVFNNGTDVYVDSPLGHQRLSKKAALLDLISTHGFREKVAREILSLAERKGHAIYRVAYAPGYGREKQASPHQSMLAGGPNAPLYFDQAMQSGHEAYGPRTSAMTQEDGEMAYPVDEMSATQTDPSTYDNWQNYQAEDFQSVMNQAQQAGARGQKEVFEASMFSGMLKNVRQDSMIERYLGSLVKALDSLGRIMFNFYWHGEEYEDRYGKSDMPELEDSLRNSFESLGDVTLFLKERSVESPLDAGEIDLEETARN